MTLGRWGSFWVRGAGWLRLFAVLRVAWCPVGPGALLGLVIGLPADAVFRLCLRALFGRVSATAFFFALGAVSALLGFVVFVMVVGGPSSYTYDSASSVAATLAGPVLVAGVLSAVASLRIVEPAEAVTVTRLGD